MAPTLISHYRLLDQLGEGGMGVVYRAEDIRLGREVAIKVLRTDAVQSGEWLGRFEREARLASSLQHPHICTIHELGEDQGQPFIAMERLEGRTIRQMLDGPLATPRVIAFARQTAEALDAAHKRGIIHRDIKPANLFITYGDHLKVLDFGLAKLAIDEPATGTLTIDASAPTLGRVSPELTRTGDTVGTTSYMSPEQALGQPLDARTDLFSLGSVMYEMATGKRAFGGDDVALIVMKIINGILIPPRVVNPDLPESLDAIIQRLLAVDPAQRYQTAGELIVDLDAAAQQLSPETAPHAAVQTAPPAPRRRLMRMAVPLALGVVMLAGVAKLTLFSQRTPALTDRDSILIGTFENATSDPVFDETLLTALKVQLEQSPFLDIVTDQRIRETLRHMDRPESAPLTHAVAREACQRLAVKAMLEGSIAPLGTDYVLTLTATDCATGETLARAQAQANTRERVLTELGAISTSMRTTLGESLPSMARFDTPIEQATTPSLSALKAYTLGLDERRRGRELESVAFFNQALEIDREFAAAHAMLSTVYGSLGEWRRSEDSARRAYELRNKVSERERLFITYQYHDRVTGDQERAAESLEMWKTAYPRDARPVNALVVIHNRLGRYERAEAEAQEALRRAPAHTFVLSNLATAYRALGRYSDARRIAEQAVALGIETSPTRRLLYQLGVLMEDGSAAVHLEWAKDKPREFDVVSAQAQVAAFEGRMRDAAELYQRAIDMALARNLRGTASGYAAHLAWTSALYGPRQEAAETVRHVLSIGQPASDAPETVPRFRAAAAFALAGMTAEAQAIVSHAAQRYPESTLVRTVLVPATRAALALGANRPQDAIEALKNASAAERGTAAGLAPIYLRAQAFLAQGEAADAVREFEKLLSSRGVDPFAPMLPLAHLGIARARAQAGDVPSSRAAYEALFTVWKKADPDLAPLVAARAEYDRLVTPPAPAAPR